MQPPTTTVPYTFYTVGESLEVPLPYHNASVQCVGQVSSLNLELSRAELRDPLAPNSTSPTLLLDTSLIPPEDFPPTGMVHVFGVLRETLDAATDTLRRTLTIEILRPVDGVNYALLCQTLQLMRGVEKR